MEPFRWNEIFTLLSLDGVVPLYEEMGLQIPDKQRFVQILRRQIVESREKYGSDKMPDIHFAEKVLEEIEGTLGRKTVEHFYQWATTVFYEVHQHQPQWSAWDDALPRHPAQLPQRLTPDRWEVIAQFREAHNIEDVEQKVRELRLQPLSDWDAELYSINGYSNVEDPMFEDEFNDPYSPILGTIEMNRFQLAWPMLWSHFSEEEKNLYWEYGRQKRKAEGLDKYDAGGLPHPDELRRQI